MKNIFFPTSIKYEYTSESDCVCQQCAPIDVTITYVMGIVNKIFFSIHLYDSYGFNMTHRYINIIVFFNSELLTHTNHKKQCT